MEALTSPGSSPPYSQPHCPCPHHTPPNTKMGSGFKCLKVSEVYEATRLDEVVDTSLTMGDLEERYRVAVRRGEVASLTMETRRGQELVTLSVMVRSKGCFQIEQHGFYVF